MKPTLTVEGKALDVWAVYYRDNKVHSVSAIDDNGDATTYHDIKENVAYYTEKPSQIDLAIALNWEGQHKEIIDKINKRIDSLEERMIELAFDYIQHDAPFAEKVESQKEWHRLNQQVRGLFQAIEIVEGKHDEGTVERFTRGVVQAAVALSRGGEEIDPE